MEPQIQLFETSIYIGLHNKKCRQVLGLIIMFGPTPLTLFEGKIALFKGNDFFNNEPFIPLWLYQKRITSSSK